MKTLSDQLPNFYLPIRSNNADWIPEELTDIYKLNWQYCSVDWLHKHLNRFKSSNLSLIHFNTRSLLKNKNKIEELLVLLEHNPDILAISETRLSDRKMHYAQIDGYHLINSYSKTNAGGVACYVKKSILFSKVTELPFDSSDCESLFLQIKGRSGKNLLIGVVYRHPKAGIQEFQNNLSPTLTFLVHYKYEYIICGDFNADFFKYGSINAIRNHIDTLHSYGCINFIDKATPITPKTATLIDHIYSNIITKSV